MIEKSRKWTARWIWMPSVVSDASKKWMHGLFRKSFFVSDITRETRAYVAADTMWKLYVNGAFVMYGVSRAPRGTACMDEVGISPFLQQGKNIVAVEVLFADYEAELMPQSPGLLCEIRQGNQVLVFSSTDWKVLECQDYEPSSLLFGFSRGYPTEILRVAEKPKDWKELQGDYSLWKQAVVVGAAGSPPWGTIELKNTPACCVSEVLPVSVVQVGTRRGSLRPDIWSMQWGKPQDKTSTEPRIGDLMQTEESLPGSDKVTNLGALLLRNGGELELRVEPDGHPFVVYDLGAEYSGLIHVEASGPVGMCLDIGWAEALDRRTGEFRPQTAHVANPLVRVKLSGTDDTAETMLVHALRYLCVVARGETTGTVHVRKLSLRLYQAIPNGKGAFSCSDAKLNRIYQSALDTLCANMADVYMDCPERERGGYLGEPYWMARLGFYALGDLSVNRRMCRLAAKTQGFRPELPGMVSTIIGSNHSAHAWYYSTAALYFELQTLLDIELSGETSLLQELLPNIEKHLEQYARFLNKEGVLEAVPTRVTWLDWSLVDTTEGGVSVGLNCFYLKVLREMAKHTGKQKYADDAEKLRQALNALPAFGVGAEAEHPCFYPDGYHREKGALVSRGSISETTQYYALWSGLPDARRAMALWRHLRHSCAPFPDHRETGVVTHVKKGGPYTFFSRLLFAVNNGDFDIAIRDLRQIGYYMASREPGTLWEQFFDTSFSLCHGFMAWSGAFLIEYCLGIRPGPQGGFSTMRIEPHGDRDLTWASGYITTAQGVIGVQWHVEDLRYTLMVTIPEGCTAAVILPPEAMAVWARGSKPGVKWDPFLTLTDSAKVCVTPGAILIEKVDKQ